MKQSSGGTSHRCRLEGGPGAQPGPERRMESPAGETEEGTYWAGRRLGPHRSGRALREVEGAGEEEGGTQGAGRGEVEMSLG